MPPLPMMGGGLNFSMNCGSSEFILEEVVGPAATASHLSPTFLMMGPQWNRALPLKSTGTFLPFSRCSSACMWTSSRPVKMTPSRNILSPSLSARTSLSGSGVFNLFGIVSPLVGREDQLPVRMDPDGPTSPRPALHVYGNWQAGRVAVSILDFWPQQGCL